jgi:hypothetical protein
LAKVIQVFTIFKVYFISFSFVAFPPFLCEFVCVGWTWGEGKVRGASYKKCCAISFFKHLSTSDRGIFSAARFFYVF